MGSRVLGEGAPGSNYNMLTSSEVHYTMIRRTFTIYILADLPVYCHFAVTLLGVSNILSKILGALAPRVPSIDARVILQTSRSAKYCSRHVCVAVCVCLSARVSQKQQ